MNDIKLNYENEKEKLIIKKHYFDYEVIRENTEHALINQNITIYRTQNNILKDKKKLILKLSYSELRTLLDVNPLEFIDNIKTFNDYKEV